MGRQCHQEQTPFERLHSAANIQVVLTTARMTLFDTVSNALN